MTEKQRVTNCSKAFLDGHRRSEKRFFKRKRKKFQKSELKVETTATVFDDELGLASKEIAI